MAMTLSPSRGRIALGASRRRLNSSASKRGLEGNVGMSANLSYAGHTSGRNASPGLPKRELSPSSSKREFTPSPVRHLPQILLADGNSPSLSPTTLSPSSSRFTARDSIYEDEDPDSPTVRVRDQDCYANPTLDQDSQHQETTPTLRAPISRPIRIRHSVRPRPRSYHDILEDFEVHARGGSMASSVATSLGAVAEERVSRIDDQGCHGGVHVGGDVHHDEAQEIRDGFQEEEVHDRIRPGPHEREPYAHENREDTARKKKRFSLPAVAVQTVPVVACSTPDLHRGWGRRFSLVLGARTRGRSGESESDGSMRSLLSSRDNQSVRSPSRGDKVGKGSRESFATRALIDVLRGRRGKERVSKGSKGGS